MQRDQRARGEAAHHHAQQIHCAAQIVQPGAHLDEFFTGEIYDETDRVEEAEIIHLEDSHYRIQGSAHLEEVGDQLSLTFKDDGEYDTLAGFLISEFGYIPTEGETLEHQGVRFVIQEADERRVIEVIANPPVASPQLAPPEDSGD